MTKVEAQPRRWTFYEAVNQETLRRSPHRASLTGVRRGLRFRDLELFNPMAGGRDRGTMAFVGANTCVVSPPLCPELRLRLLKKDAPLKDAAPARDGNPHLFDWQGPRPYWAFAWASGQALARFIFDNPEIVRGKRVVDFGAGSGIAAIAAAVAGAASVIAADVDPIAVEAIILNASLNDVAVSATQEDVLTRSESDWEVLLAGDVFYGGGDTTWFLDLARKDRLILIGDPPERGFPKGHLTELARYSVRTFPDLEHPSLQEACVYCLRLRARISNAEGK
jgi:predicted nicotinamide N-methyase